MKAVLRWSRHLSFRPPSMKKNFHCTPKTISFSDTIANIGFVNTPDEKRLRGAVEMASLNQDLDASPRAYNGGW